LHPLTFVKEITKENDVASDFSLDLGLCSSSASQLWCSLLLSSSGLFQAGMTWWTAVHCGLLN